MLHPQSTTTIHIDAKTSVPITTNADGYIDAHKMCDALDKRWSNFWRPESKTADANKKRNKGDDKIQQFAKLLQTRMSKPVVIFLSGVHKPKAWIAPPLALKLAAWLDSRLDVELYLTLCSQQRNGPLIPPLPTQSPLLIEAEAQTALVALNHTVLTLTRENATLVEEKDAAVARQQEAEKHISQSVVEIAGLKQHLQTAESELTHARNEKKALEKTKEAEFQQKVSELEKQKASALEAVNAKVSDAESKLRLLLVRGQSKFDLLNGEKQQLAVKEAELQTALNGLQTQLTAATTTVEALTTEKQQLQSEVETMSMMKRDYVGMQERLGKAIEDKDEYEAECRRQLRQRLEEVEARAKTCPADVERDYVRRDQLFPFVKQWESDRKQLAETRLKAATLEGDSYHQAYIEWQLQQDNEKLALRHEETGKRLLEAAAAHFGTEAETAAKIVNASKPSFKRRSETDDENADDEDIVDSALKRQRQA
jgi:hypothetical protein